jgi:hypothetical protein
MLGPSLTFSKTAFWKMLLTFVRQKQQPLYFQQKSLTNMEESISTPLRESSTVHFHKGSCMV